ncbi:MAG: glycosyltransferase family 87 protein [Acidimicrobiales bacterium]
MTSRLTLYPRLCLLALAAAFAFAVLSGDGSSTASGRLGGDYPAFYTAGTLVTEGRLGDLYDPAAQAAVQRDLLGGEDGYLAFAYSPAVAALYAPLAALPYRTSYLVHTVLMVAALVGALWLIRPLVPLVDRWFSLVLAATVTSYPVFMAVGGGQNTALTMVLLAVIWRSLADDREVAAGIAAALMLFRPQYGLPMIGLLLIGRHHRAAATAVAGAAVTFLANATLLGWSWIGSWLDQVGPFLETDAEVNAANSVSALGFLQAVLGTESAVALVLGATASLIVGAVLVWTWWGDHADLGGRMAVTAIGLILLSPHAMFYDAGLVAFTLLVLVDRRIVEWTAAAAVWALALAHLSRGALGASPFALVVAAVFVFVARELTIGPNRSADLTLAVSA